MNNKEKILFIGDSLASGLATSLDFYHKDKFIVENKAVVGSGFTSKNPYPWFDNILFDLANSDAKTVVISLGTNDVGNNLKYNKNNYAYNSIEFNNLYQDRLKEVIDFCKVTGKEIIYVPMPKFANKEFEDKSTSLKNLFNNTIKENNLNSYNIDKFQTDKYKALDKLHYNSNGYKSLIEDLMQQKIAFSNQQFIPNNINLAAKNTQHQQNQNLNHKNNNSL